MYMLKFKCPACGKRLCDTNVLDARIEVQLKCPHCGVISAIKLSQENILIHNRKQGKKTRHVVA